MLETVAGQVLGGFSIGMLERRNAIYTPRDFSVEMFFLFIYLFIYFFLKAGGYSVIFKINSNITQTTWMR